MDFKTKQVLLKPTVVKILCAMLLVFTFSATLTSCSDDDDDENSGIVLEEDMVPETLGECTFTWDEHYDIVSGPDAGKSSGDMNQRLYIFNDTDCKASWSANWGTYNYSKTGENTARLSFYITRNVVGHVQSWRYTLDLTFSAKGIFTMTGSKVITSNMNGTTRCEIHSGEGSLTEGLDS